MNVALLLSVVCCMFVSIFVRVSVPIRYRLHAHIFIGGCLIYSLYGNLCIPIVIVIMLSYFMLYLPGKLIYLGILIPISGLGWIHAKRLGEFGEWKTDLSGLIMFSSLRFIMLLYNLSDGRKKEIKRTVWKNMALKTIPSFSSYIAYIFSYNGLISGPLMPFKVFESTLYLASTPEEIKEDIKSALKSWYSCMAYGAAYALSLVIFPVTFFEQESVLKLPLFVRLVLADIFGFTRSSRYCFAWLGAEAGLKALGAHRTTAVDKENLRSMRVKEYFTLKETSGITVEWNHSMHFFLKEFIHTRVISLGYSVTLAKIATFTFSAYWHGFYPGYYIFAVIMMVNSFLDSFRRRNLTPRLEKLIGTKMSSILECVWVQFVNFYTGGMWDMLWVPHILAYHRACCYVPYLMMLALSLVSMALGRPKARKET